jgi:hypothetical protein
MSKTAIALVAAAVLAGCAQLPQTRPEFQQVVRSGAASGRTDTHVARRSLDDAVRLLRPRLAECFDYNVTWSRTEGAAVGMFKEKWHSSVRLIDRNRAEATVQRVVGGAVQKQPEGGIYMVALDLERIDSTNTKLTYYGTRSAFGNSTWESLKQWSEGRAAACPTGIV